VKRWLTFLILLVALASNSAAGAESLSDQTVEQLLKRVIERAGREPANDAAFNAHYAFTRTKCSDAKDGSGTLKKRDEKVIKHEPSNSPAITPKTIYSGYESGSKPAPASAPATNGKARQAPKQDLALTAELLGRFRFTLVGREVIDGRPAAVLEFSPAKRALPETSMKDKFINKMAGRLWVDESDAALVKVNLRLTEEVPIAAGLVGAVKQCAYSFERARTPEGWWFTKLVNWRLEGRQLFSRRVWDYHEEKKDIRKVW
jgi:hypothetical protein